ncbi:MAG: hypothetical protein VKL20_06135 [Synechocystis sp.]|nr:hypothetical protein [Synechocystis sp.]
MNTGLKIVAPCFLTTLALMIGSQTAIAKDVCIPLELVGGQGSSVTKTVSQPTIPSPLPGIDITKDNWNTDWAVPTLTKFDYFQATITSEGGTFNIAFYVKYNDQTAQKFFDEKGVEITPDKPLVIKATPGPKDEPYQVNLFNGGLDRIGNTFTANVVGCTKK